MGAERSGLTVVYARRAREQLDEIWKWNALRYGIDHAEQYVDFLDRHTQVLRAAPESGNPVDGRKGLRYILIQRKSNAHGHVVVYRVWGDQLRVLNVFHTAQNWRAIVQNKKR